MLHSLDRGSGPTQARSPRPQLARRLVLQPRRLLLLLLFVTFGCVSQDIDVAAPAISLREVTVRVLPDTEYIAAAATLGWTSGVPEVDVRLRQLDSAATPLDSGRTVKDGITLGPLAAARYGVSLLRPLTAPERSSLPGISFEGLALDAEFSVTSADTLSIMALGATRGSLVTSEWFFTAGWYGEFPYDLSGYWELYNASDTTIYLDGLMLGQGFAQFIETNPYSCSQSEKEWLPPNGVWVQRFDKFPGGGSDYPLQPGEVAVVAGYAIDHRPVFRNALDLREADFEFGSPSGVNNPDVPNMIWLGPERAREGAIFASGIGVPIVMLPVDPYSLPVQYTTKATSPQQFRKVPIEYILDIFAWRPATPGFTPCRFMINPAINVDVETRGAAPDPFLVSTHRRLLTTTGNGRRILIRTRSSKTDFEDGLRTPGVLP